MSIRGALSGLDAIKAKAESKGGNFDGESPFLQLKDGNAVKMRFMQELDEKFPGYDARRGKIVVVEEHTSPKDYRKRAVCSMEEEGRCWACQQAAGGGEIAKKWKPKMRFYANVLVRGTDETPDKVKILAQGFGKSNIGNDILDMSVEYEGLSAQDFKLTRKGAGMNDTNYTLMPLPPKALTKAEKELEMLDLSKFIKFVSYDDQDTFYSAEDGGAEKSDW